MPAKETQLELPPWLVMAVLKEVHLRRSRQPKMYSFNIWPFHEGDSNIAASRY